MTPFERGEIGPDVFAAACRMRLEGIVSKTSASRTSSKRPSSSPRYLLPRRLVQFGCAKRLVGVASDDTPG